MSGAGQLQPDDEPVIQDFLNNFGQKKPQTIWRPGRVGATNDSKRPYVSSKILYARLDLGRVRALLDALFKNWDKSAPDAEYTREHCLRTFAILITIGHGRMIYEFAKRPNLHDRHLPHLSEPHDFPSSTQVNLFSQFYGKQWGFCPQPMVYNMSHRLPPNVILPILKMDVIDEDGGSASMHKIQVDEDHNGLQPPDDNDLQNGHQCRNTFALKTYRTEDAKKYYETESDAFKHLRHLGRPPPNIIAFYGGFEREDTYNIILEYADGGNLNEFMRRAPPPINPNELSIFWDQFFNIFHGLAHIHGEGREGVNEPHMLLGWHQDINPANILVKSRPNASCPYDAHFKIADLGLSHFKRHTSGLGKAKDKDTFGTRAYGAPETHRSDFNVENSSLQVKQDVDIWSMGCVTSEVVTWVSQGWDKVLDYRRRRLEEVHQRCGRREESFHDDWGNLLKTVENVHEENMVNCRRNDESTKPIIKNLISEMLLETHEHRPNAEYLYRKAKRIIKTVSGTVDDVTPRRSPYLLPQSPPPNRPPPRRSSVSSGSLSIPNYISLNSRPSLGEGSRNASGSIYSVSSVQDSQGLRVYSNTDHQSPPYSPDDSNYFGNQPVHDTLPGYHQSQLDHRPEQADSWDASLRDRRPSIHDLSNLSLTSDNPTSQAKKQEDWKPPPALSVQKGIDLLQKNLDFPDKYLMEELRGRDHAFLIDNATSSRDYRLQMRNVLELLATKLDSPDLGGLDLYFTAPYKKLKRQNVNAILNHFDSIEDRDMPDMRSCFATILSEYQEKFGKIRIVGKIKHPKTTPFVGPRKLSLYVLTDGIWQPNVDLVREIQTMVEHLMDKKLTNMQVGIQFIRFGKNPQAIKKLKRLDSGVDFKLELVDTTPADGNVWKMLHGAINPWFHADREDDDMESSQGKNVGRGSNLGSP